MDVYHFKNFEMLDPEAGELRGGHELVVEGDTIREISAKPIKLAQASVIDCGGRTLMPGLIDSHVHVVLSEVVIRNMENVPLTLMTARAARLMHNMLDRGFTSVRDTGGADWGLKEATDKGLIPGPRLFIAGRAVGAPGPPPAALISVHAVYAATLCRSPWASRTASPKSAARCARKCARVATR